MHAMENGSSHARLNRIAFVGNYLPRQCGIATFTTLARQEVADERNAVEPCMA